MFLSKKPIFLLRYCQFSQMYLLFLIPSRREQILSRNAGIYG